MSTKIYHAWRKEGLTTLKQVQQFGRQVLAPAITKIIHDNLRQHMADPNLTGKELRTSYFKKFYQQEDAHLARLLSPKVEMCFFPSRRGVMMVPFCEGVLHDRSIHEYLDSLKDMRPWGYWNNSDRPEEVSAREWRLRRNDWENLFGNGYPTFGEVGLTMTMHGDFNPYVDLLWPLDEYPEVYADLIETKEVEQDV